MPTRWSRAALAVRWRGLAAEGRALARAGFGLTAREREGVVLVAALFAAGLAVRWLRWILGA